MNMYNIGNNWKIMNFLLCILIIYGIVKLYFLRQCTSYLSTLLNYL